MLPVVPEYLAQTLRSQYGVDTAEEIEAGFGHVRPVTLRVNTCKTDTPTVCRQLDEAGIAWRTVDWYADALIIDGVREDTIQAFPMYERGEIYLQGLSAMIPALVLGARKCDSVLDMAAAPGGKTTQLAALSENGASITACEKNKIRADRLRFNVDRQGAKHVMVMNTDARQLDDMFRFGRILLDAPCTGSGTILLTEGEPQRRMDIPWVQKTVATQAAMLKKALRLLSAGGEMVYSTCSIMACENEDVLRRALEGVKAEIVPIDPALMAAVPCLPTELPGTMVVKPTELYEGFYVAKIRKLK